MNAKDRKPSFFFAKHPQCGHKVTIWALDLTIAEEAKEHPRYLREAKKGGFVVEQAPNKDAELDGFGEWCATCCQHRAKRVAEKKAGDECSG